MSEQDKKIWDTIIEIAIEERKQTEILPDEMTITDFVNKTGMKRAAAKKFLDNKVEMGELTVRQLPQSGGTRVYKPT